MTQGKGPSCGGRWSSCAQLGSSRPPIQYNSLFLEARWGKGAEKIIKSVRHNLGQLQFVYIYIFLYQLYIYLFHLHHIYIYELYVRYIGCQVYTLKHDITDVQCLMPGLLLGIRKVVRLKVVGSERLASCSDFYTFNNYIPDELAAVAKSRLFGTVLIICLICRI